MAERQQQDTRPQWRVGSKVPINIYEGDRPICQCHTAVDAKRIVAAVNGESVVQGDQPATRNGSFWVIERFLNGKSFGYWAGDSSREFVLEIDHAIQFCRREDAWRIKRGWHWADTEVTEHLYMAAVQGEASPTLATTPPNETWRVGRKLTLGRKVTTTVYSGDRPVCNCHADFDAALIVAAVNTLREGNPPDCNISTDHECCVARMKRLEKERRTA